LLNFPVGEVNREMPNATTGQPTYPNTTSKPIDSANVAPIEQATTPTKEVVKKEFKLTHEGNYSKKVDFKKIDRQLDSYKDSTMDELKPVVKFIYNDLIDQIERKKILEKKSVERIDDLQVKKMKDVKIILKNAFRSQYQEAKKMAQQELFKSEFALPLPSEEFMAFLEDETYSFVGDWAYNITKSAKTALIKAIKDGEPLSEVNKILDNEGQKLSLTSLERYARTKFTEVMNRGRLEFFDESGIVTGYQYSAILDDATTDVCSGLHNKIFKAGDQPVPPLHFNCRSVLIPITKYEEIPKYTKVTESMQEEIGKGFSWQ